MQVVIRWLSGVLDYLAQTTGSYGIAVILFTIAIRAVLLPLTILQTRSLQATTAMKPEMERLQKKYGADPERLQMEMSEVYRKYKTSPTSGCILPFLQLPLIIALIQSIHYNEGLKEAVFLGLNLGQPGGAPLAAVAAATTWLSMKFSPAMAGGQQGQSQNAMSMVMVAMMVVFAWRYAAGVSLYIAVGNLVGIAEKFVMPKPPGDLEGATPSEKR